MATKADLRRLVLTKLTIIDETELPSIEQASLLDIFIASCRAELREKGLVWWDEDAIPDEALLPLRDYVAAKCCGDFGRAGKGFEAGEAIGRAGLAAVKSSDQREEQRAEYF